MATCLHCGQENRAHARFCDSCGKPLVPTTAREERKVVSVLFADLVGSTATAEQLDPEDVRGLQEPYWQHVRSEIARHGGTLEKFIGDAVVALFGAPVTHEDDAERAVRAALAIREWTQEQPEIQVRIGITTGEALVRLGAEPLAGEGMASGDVVNTASRLQEAAGVNAILVDETTRRATKEMIDYADSEPVTAKGKAAPIPVWEAQQARSRLGVDLVQHGRTPLVGRELEVDLLKAALRRVRDNRSPQLVTLVGVPGIGKSRLVYELMQAVAAEPDIVRWRQGRSLPYGDGVAFWALGEIVKAEAGILETDSEVQADAKLTRAVKAAVGHEADWVLRHLRPLIGRGNDATAGDRRDESFAAWRHFFESLAEQRPSVFVFEDLHWADEGLLDFIDHLVEWAGRVPMLVVCTARPELLERRADWAGGKLNISTLALAPLRDDETATLLKALLGGKTQSKQEWASLLEHAGGHPLYAEQFALLFREHGSLEGLPPPETVQGIIAARLDALPVTEKLLLQDAAVVGKVFWSGALPALARASTALHTLERKEFVQREPQSIVEGEEQYAFRHVLVRDIAYGQIPRFDRASKHLSVAKWIESLARAEDHAETAAHHYLAALEYVQAAGGDIGPFREPAKKALRSAGRRALALNANTASATFFGAALELSPSQDELPELLFCYGKALARTSAPDEEVLVRARDAMLTDGDADRAAECDVILGELLWRRGERGRAFSHLHAAIAMLERRPASPAQASALSTLSRFRMAADEPAEALDLAQAAMVIADKLGLDDLRADALITIGLARVAKGDRSGLHDLERSIEVADERNSPQSIRGNFNLASMLANLGDLRGARPLYSRGYELAERFGDAAWIEFFEAERVYQRYWSGEWDTAVTLAEELIAGADTSARRTRIDGWLVLGWIALARGDIALALEAADRACAFSREASDPQDLYPALAFRAHILVNAGQYPEASECATELLGLLRERPSLPSFWVIDLAIALRKLERGHELSDAMANAPSTRWLEAATAYVAGNDAEAAAICAEIGAEPEEAYARLEAARTALEAGRRADAEAQLARAKEFFIAVGAVSSSRRAEALLTN